jgi:methionyl aminopeptidase
MKITLKTPDEIKQMREAGLLLWETHQVAAKMLASGVTTKEIDAEVESFIIKRKAIPLFKGVPGETPYPASTCISLNEQIVHGIPSERKLCSGDIVSIDIGVKLNGWCADAAVTHPIGNIDAEKKKLLDVTENSLREDIALLATAQFWSEIAKKTSAPVLKEGFSIVEELVGHGIGREMWEQPQIPNYYSRRIPDFRLRPGMVLAIEPMVNVGVRDIRILPDHWTIVTADGLPSAHFEHSIALTETGPVVLTCGPNNEGWAM